MTDSRGASWPVEKLVPNKHAYEHQTGTYTESYCIYIYYKQTEPYGTHTHLLFFLPLILSSLVEIKQMHYSVHMSCLSELFLILNW